MEKETNVIEKEEIVETLPKGAPIIIPNADMLTPDELRKAKHAEKIRRYRQRRDTGVVVPKPRKSELRKMSTEQMVELAKNTRNIAVQTLHKKLVNIYEDPEQLEKINIAHLATVFGILFDKAQLAAGLATENIAIHAKIDVNMSSDKALEELNKMREQYSEVNTK